MALDLVTQSYLSATSYEQVLTLPQHMRILKRGFRELGIRRIPHDLPNQRFAYGNTDNPLCIWLEGTTWVEPTLYDHVVPAESVTPISLYPNDLPWVALTWCMDPYENSKPYPELGSQFYEACMRDKDEPYLMKSLVVTDIELSWICYNVIDGVYLLHHNQIRGTMRDRLSRTDQVWYHRYMVRMFAAMLPEGSTIVVPDSQTFDKYLDVHPEFLRMPMTPFSRHVLGKSQFKAIDGTELCKIAPNLHDKLYFTHELPSGDQRYWIRTT